MDWLFGETPIATAREFGSYNMDDSFIIDNTEEQHHNVEGGIVKRDNSLNGILFSSMQKLSSWPSLDERWELCFSLPP